MFKAEDIEKEYWRRKIIADTEKKLSYIHEGGYGYPGPHSEEILAGDFEVTACILYEGDGFFMYSEYTADYDYDSYNIYYQLEDGTQGLYAKSLEDGDFARILQEMLELAAEFANAVQEL